MQATLYVLPGSHPCAAVEAALELKRIPYRRVDMLPFVQVAWGPLRYGGRTVPGLRLNGERLVGSRDITHRLDELVPEPALVPGDPGLRERVLEAERWGDEVLQAAVRRIADAVMVRHPATMETYARGARLRVPIALLRPSLGLTARLLSRYTGSNDESVRRDLAELPGWLDHVDTLISEGVIGGGAPNAADLQIGSSIRLMSDWGDLRPLIADRPLAALVEWFAPSPGSAPAGLLPAEWLPRADR